ncbi:MAG: hypothetical protein IKQ17_09495 [Kiritimatiellae bacterium]|nr:hypothetical protein [Kiritimatiellia bacterium]
MNYKILSEDAVAARPLYVPPDTDDATRSGNTVTATFRGYWRDEPTHDESGNVIVDDIGKFVTCRQFKVSRSFMLKGKICRETALISEADAKKHGLEEDVKYNLTIQILHDCTLSDDDAKGSRFGDEFLITGAKIVSVNARLR